MVGPRGWWVLDTEVCIFPLSYGGEKWGQHGPCGVGIVPAPRWGMWLVPHPEMP